MLAALRAKKAFSASAHPEGADGSRYVGWASDGRSYWRLQYDVVGGCSPVYSDDIETRTCDFVGDRGDSCEWLESSLCFYCGYKQ